MKTFRLTKTLTFILFLISINCLSQDTIDYFGLEAPELKPEIFAPGIISTTTGYEELFMYSDDGKQILYVETNSMWELNAIYYTKYDSGWADPYIPPFLNDEYIEYLGGFLHDGSIYFYSSRPNTTGDIKQYIVKKSGDGWAEPFEIPTDSLFPTVSNSVNDTSDIYTEIDNSIAVSKYKNGKHQPPVILTGGINSTISLGLWCISPDENYLLLNGKENSNSFGSDIFISYKRSNNTWTKAYNLKPYVSTSDNENGPSLSPDGKYLFFHRRLASNASGDIYWVDFQSLIDSILTHNKSPYVINPIADTTIYIGQEFNLQLSDSTFMDDDGNETLTFSAMQSSSPDLPDSLAFNPETKTFSGKLLTAGNFDIKVVATDTAGENASDVFTLNVIDPDGIENSITKSISVYPNPASEILYINYQGIQKEIKYELLDLSGKTVIQGRLTKKSIDISGIEKGIYILILNNDKETIYKKLLVQ